MHKAGQAHFGTQPAISNEGLFGRVQIKTLQNRPVKHKRSKKRVLQMKRRTHTICVWRQCSKIVRCFGSSLAAKISVNSFKNKETENNQSQNCFQRRKTTQMNKSNEKMIDCYDSLRVWEWSKGCPLQQLYEWQKDRHQKKRENASCGL